MNGAIVVGAGAAGLAVALRLSARMPVTLVCKAPLGSGCATGWAQGGIAAAVGSDDSPVLHAADTERAGGGITDRSAVEILTGDAPERMAELIALGMNFDRESDGSLALGQEAAHSRRRILHAGGDATGRELLRILVQAVRQAPITIIEASVDELIVEAGRVIGIRGHRRCSDREVEFFRLDAAAVILATGGCGQLFRFTTNPVEATGDGIAIAARAGAELIDLEFVQFHPTALAAGLDPMPLLTEALRGEGGRLIDMNGCAIMDGRDLRGDLAPRDIVARAVFETTIEGRRPALDVRGIADFAARFPTVFAAAQAAGLDPARNVLPIASAAHYHMGGVAVTDQGRTSLAGLWACGETAATGVHGANRLASNSLLEAIVFAAHLADDVAEAAYSGPRPVHTEPPYRRFIEYVPQEEAWRSSLREIMYRNVGVIRDAQSLTRALREIEAIEVATRLFKISQALANLLLVGQLITLSALARRETRGSHQRRDYPFTDLRLAYRARRTLASSNAADHAV